MDLNLTQLSERVGDTGDFISIDRDKCVGCGNCVNMCLVALWKIRGGKAYIDDDYKVKCLECSACWQVCDSGAINFQYPAGGTGVVYKKG